VVRIDLLYRSDHLSLEQLALIETLGIGAHAVERSQLQRGESALIVGAGPIGLATAPFVALCRAAAHVVEKNRARRGFVSEMGYSVTETAEGRQADVVFDATGSAVAMAGSLDLVAPAGRLVYVGLAKEPICLDDSTLHRWEVALMASRNSFSVFPHIIH